MPETTRITIYRFDELAPAAQAKAIRSLKGTNARTYVDFAMRREAALLGLPFPKIRLLRRRETFIIGMDGVLSLEQTRALVQNPGFVEHWKQPMSRECLQKLRELLQSAIADAEDEGEELVGCSTYYEGTPFLVDCGGTVDEESAQDLLHTLVNGEMLERLEDIRDGAFKGRFDKEAASEFLSGERWRFLKDGSIAAGI